MKLLARTLAAYLAAAGALLAQSSVAELRERAELALQANEPAQALELLEQAVDLNPENPEPVAQLMETLLAAGDVQTAMTLAVQAQRRFPDHIGVQYWFGVGSYYLGAEPFLRLALRNLEDVDRQHPRTRALRSLLR